METKLFEIRDEGTHITAIGILMSLPESEAERYCLRRCGYSLDLDSPSILLAYADGSGHARSDEYDWPGRTMKIAHHHIRLNWHKLTSGDVVDVEFVLGERTEPKQSERLAERQVYGG